MEVTSVMNANLELGVSVATPTADAVDLTSTTALNITTQAVAGPSKPGKNRVRAKPQPMDEQPTAADLAKIGIKVRDFAYEKTGLPPVRTIYRHPRQIQPGVNRNGVQRQLTETAEDGVFSQQSQESSQPLERTVTEPVFSPPPPPTRQQGFLNLEDYVQPDQNVSAQSASSSRSAVNVHMDPPIPNSQNSNGIKTPLATPNGSLQWHHPTSDDAPTFNLSLKATVLDKSLVVERRFSQSNHRPSSQENISSGSRLSILSALSSPLSSAPSSPIPYLSPLRSKKSIQSKRLLQRQASCLVTPRGLRNHTTPEKPPTTKRYNLRKRPANASDKVNPNPSKRMKFTPAEPVVRPTTISAQSMQSRNGLKAEGASPSSRRLPPRTSQHKRGKRRTN